MSWELKAEQKSNKPNAKNQEVEEDDEEKTAEKRNLKGGMEETSPTGQRCVLAAGFVASLRKKTIGIY